MATVSIDADALALLRARVLYLWLAPRGRGSLSYGHVVKALALDAWDTAVVLDVLQRLPPAVVFRLDDGVLELSLSDPDDCQAVFDHWRKAVGRERNRLTAKRKAVINARLQQGYIVAELCTAIDGLASSDWHRGNNDRGTTYLDIELVCRSDENVERFMSMATGRKSDPNESQIDAVRREWASKPR